MTPEEFDRNMELIVEHQAKCSTHLEDLASQLKGFEVVLGQIAVDHQRMVNLFDIQSRRLGRAETEDRDAQKRRESLLLELRAAFDRILEKL